VSVYFVTDSVRKLLDTLRIRNENVKLHDDIQFNIVRVIKSRR
jgi:hypothetical protein